MPTDIQIASAATLKPIAEIAAQCGISVSEYEPYGHYAAKINQTCMNRLCNDSARGKLILVTAVNPTPAGEGKTTTSIGLAQGLCKIGKRAVLALREPSLGPVFGVKGGAAGGGYAQVLPMEDINLHFTGDMHAITSANNLLCALLDNHIQQGNALRIDTNRVLVKRCIDMNDRVLRNTVVGLGGKVDGTTRQDGFIITVASEVMAILCLAEDLSDLKARLGKILVGYSLDNAPIYAADLGAVGAMAALLKHAINPNLVQTIENTPAIIHGGPFANIAHGCNSIRATKLALTLGDYAVTEAGFGSDLGAEKFINIKCRAAGLTPDCAVLVATVRALKHNGDGELERGIVNLGVHIDNLAKFGLPVVVAINHFHTDTDDELSFIHDYCKNKGVTAVCSRVFAQGGKGGVELAAAVVNACGGTQSKLNHTYKMGMSVEDKIEAIAHKIYRADGVTYSTAAIKAIREIADLGLTELPVCMAKTQYSLSDDASKLGNPTGWRLNVTNLRVAAGAGFIIVYTGDIMTLPGLPKVPSANHINIDKDGNISGLF
ncbi:MAG: formate--tetrahydrofolate ligase [Oscillospiraceae bacterium]|nr:formate--tetrahydrofolate ligase [Oscillospiraceae bacterium]